MKKSYQDHSWLKQDEGIVFGRASRSSRRACIWMCIRCGTRMTAEGDQHPTLQNQLDQGIHLNCDVVIVTCVMLS